MRGARKLPLLTGRRSSSWLNKLCPRQVVYGGTVRSEQLELAWPLNSAHLALAPEYASLCYITRGMKLDGHILRSTDQRRCHSASPFRTQHASLTRLHRLQVRQAAERRKTTECLRSSLCLLVFGAPFIFFRQAIGYSKKTTLTTFLLCDHLPSFSLAQKRKKERKEGSNK